ncbi:MAG: hypothetical protein L6Q71_09125, partial [Planctomycetes bacterium]|nr:hypothetical protein [Planctomycetota bacterium]
YGQALDKELAVFATSPILDRKYSSADVFAESLLLSALTARSEDTLLSATRSIVAKRAPELAKLLNRHAGDFTETKEKKDSAGLLAQVFHVAYALATLEQLGQKIARPSGYTKAIGELLTVIERGDLPELESERERKAQALLLGATLKLVSSEYVVTSTQKGRYEKCHAIVTKLFEERFRSTDDPFGAGGILLGFARGFLPPWTKRDLIRSIDVEDDVYGAPKLGSAPLASMLQLDDPATSGNGLSRLRTPPLTDSAFTLMAAAIEHASGRPPLAGLGEEHVLNLLDAMTRVEKSEQKAAIKRSAESLNLDIPQEEFVAMVNDAVTRAAEWLASTQNADGSFPGTYSRTLGGHALCLLTLLDAELPREDERVGLALKRLRGFKNFAGNPYDAGIVLMAYQKYYEAEQRKAGAFEAEDGKAYLAAVAKAAKAISNEDQTLIQAAAHRLFDNSAGYGWGYNGAARNKTEYYDNSNSQYAVLGLRAASLLGVEFNRKILMLELERVLGCFNPASGEEAESFEMVFDTEGNVVGTGAANPPTKGKTTSKQKFPGKCGGWGYGTAWDKGSMAENYLAMAAAGVSTLVVCRDEMKLLGLLTPELNRKSTLAVEGARRFMGKRYTFLYPKDPSRWGADLDGWRNTADGWGMFYDMYSVERACVLANIDKLGGDIDWYRHGAMILLAAQEDDGSWPGLVYPKGYGEKEEDPRKQKTADYSRMQTVNICMAILFLKKASVPTQELEKRRRPVTGRQKGESKPTVDSHGIGQ